MRKLAAAIAILVTGAAPVLVIVAGPAEAITGPNNTLTTITPSNGWTTPNFAADYVNSVTGEKWSSAAIGDINADGVPDVVAGFPDGWIYAWRTDTGARWFSFYTGAGSVTASPVLIDYDRDGVLDIVYANTSGNVGVVRSNGTSIMTASFGGPRAGAFATPAVADLDGNGNYEIVVTGWDQKLHVYMENGLEMPGFPVDLQDTSWSSPVVGDIDGDGHPDIVAGYDCDGAPGQTCYPNYGGYVGAWHSNGTVVAGWPRFVQHQVVWSTPALADLDGDGRLEVVVGNGNMPATMWDGGRQPMAGRYLYAFRGDGSTEPGWPIDVGVNIGSSPAIGDITGDGKPEVAVVADNGYLYTFSGNGALLWQQCADIYLGTRPGGGCNAHHAQVSIADVDNDGHQDVVVGCEQYLRVFNNTGQLTWSGGTFNGANPMTAAPTVAQVNGKTWIVEVTATTMNGTIPEHGVVFAWTTNTPLGQADWPTFKRGKDRGGSTVAVPLGTPTFNPTVGLFRPVTPARILDTRDGTGVTVAGPIHGNASVWVNVLGRGNVPSNNVAAVALNVTAVLPQAAGHIRAYPATLPEPNASNLNFVAGRTAANMVMVPIGPNGMVSLTNNSQGGTDMVADVFGYYLTNVSTPGAFTSILPNRVLDTRSEYGGAGALNPGQSLALTVAGHSGIPVSGASAVALTVTAVLPTDPGNIAARPTGGSQSTASNVNFVAGQIVPNMVIVPIGAGGSVTLVNNSTGHTQLVADVAGYFVAGSVTASGGYVPVTPTRLLDTRTGQGATGPVNSDGTVTVQITGAGTVPASSVGAVVGNISAVQPAAPGNIAAYPAGGTMPVTSNVNFDAGNTVSNLGAVSLGVGGQIALSNHSVGRTQLVFDLQGYYLS